MKNMLYKLRYNFGRFMYGRNGQDDLAVTFYWGGFIAYLIGALTNNGYIAAVSIPLFGYAFFRIFSKNIVKRRNENAKFRSLMRKPKKYITLIKLQWQNRRTHRCYICRDCGQIVRVPKGRGKIEITCPKCGAQFEKRT